LSAATRRTAALSGLRGSIVITTRTIHRAGRGVAAAALLLSAGCASTGTAAPSPAPSPTGGGASTQGAASPLVQVTWPVRTREHVDLWLHTYALLTPDSALVPYFRRGYREQMIALRRQRGATSLLDANRARLLERLAVQPSLATGPQFMPFYFASWDQLRQVVDLFIRAGGNPRATNDAALQQYFAVLGSAFQSAADREWLRLFVEAADDESRKFYHEYWLAESSARAGTGARTDSMWQRTWRPAFQRFLNNTQQQNGELYLSLPLDGEGRTVHFTKVQNAVAVGFPDNAQSIEIVLYTFAHEVAGNVASTAIEDNTTPADRRAGTTARYEQSAAVRAGALLLEKILPSAVPGYMRYYLQSTGRSAPSEPSTAFTSVFAVPDAINSAIARQIDVILGGI
jgi:hypothetical protein